jgi:hypothetical protein
MPPALAATRHLSAAASLGGTVRRMSFGFPMGPEADAAGAGVGVAFGASGVFFGAGAGGAAAGGDAAGGVAAGGAAAGRAGGAPAASSGLESLPPMVAAVCSSQ